MKKRRIRIILTIVLPVILALFAVVRFGFLSPSGTVEMPGVSLRVTEVTEEGMTCCLSNATEQDVFFGAPYSIEKQDLFGWRKAKLILSSGWTQELYAVTAGSEGTIELNWTGLYGDLPPGEYRLVKELYADGSAYTVSAGFTVR